MLFGGQIKKDEMSGVCGTYGGQERYRVFASKPDGKGYLEDLSVDGIIILK